MEQQATKGERSKRERLETTTICFIYIYNIRTILTPKLRRYGFSSTICARQRRRSFSFFKFMGKSRQFWMRSSTWKQSNYNIKGDRLVYQYYI